MNRLSFLFVVAIAFIAGPQVTEAMVHFSDTTQVLLPGTYFKEGKIYVSNGYKASFSKDEKVVTITKTDGNIVSGTYTTRCPKNKGAGCAFTKESDQGISIIGTNCCSVDVKIHGSIYSKMLTAYSMKTKEKDVPLQNAIITKTSRGGKPR